MTRKIICTSDVKTSKLHPTRARNFESARIMSPFIIIRDALNCDFICKIVFFHQLFFFFKCWQLNYDVNARVILQHSQHKLLSNWHSLYSVCLLSSCLRSHWTHLVFFPRKSLVTAHKWFGLQLQVVNIGLRLVPFGEVEVLPFVRVSRVSYEDFVVGHFNLAYSNDRQG